MFQRVRSEGGFLVIELMAAVVIISIALLALMAAYDQSFFSLHSAAKTSAASQLGDNQLELYAALPYASIGLDASTLTTVKSTDANYSTDEAALPAAEMDATISGCGSSPQCAPVQTLTGSDGHSYKIETFIRYMVNSSAHQHTEKSVTVIVRNLSQSGSPVVWKMQTAFDSGLPPAASSPPVVACVVGPPPPGTPTCESLLIDPTVVSSTVLTIVYTDDQPMATGAYAPNAYLNGQQLGLATSGTSGWVSHYVDTNGGSAGTANQDLLTITLPQGLAPGPYSIVITAYDTDGGDDFDQWSWPITVGSTGTVTSNYTYSG